MSWMLFLLLLACGGRDETATLEPSYEMPVAREKLRADTKLFYLASIDNRTLYYDPVSELYLRGKLIPEKMQKKYLVPPIFEEPISYLTYLPTTINGYTYIGQLDQWTRLYTNKKGLFREELTVISFQASRTNYEMKEEERAFIYPVLDESSPWGYYFTDFNHIYHLNENLTKLTHFSEMSYSNSLILAKKWQEFIYIPQSLIDQSPDIGDIFKKMKTRAYRYYTPNLDLLNIPLPLRVIIAFSSSLYPQKEYLAYTNALDKIFQYYEESLQGKGSSFIQQDLTKIFPIIFKYLTNEDTRRLYIKSLQNDELSRSSITQLWAFQSLLEVGVPMPNDLEVDSYNDVKKVEEQTPIIHFLARHGYVSALEMMLMYNPDYDISVKDSNGFSVSQRAIIEGNHLFLKKLLELAPNIDVHEVTPDHKTWIDLAYELPLYNFYANDDQDVEYEYAQTRSYILTGLALRFGIHNNIPLITNFVYDPQKPRSMASLQALYKKDHPDFQFILPHEISPGHAKLFENEVPKDMELKPYIMFASELHIYPSFVHDNYARLVKFFVNGANVDYHQMDTNGNNVLAYVVQTDRRDLFDFFIDKGVFPYNINNKGQNLMHLTFKKKWDSWEDNRATIYFDALANLGLDVNLLDKEGNTPYSYFMSSKCEPPPDIVEKFHQLGADPLKGKYTDTNMLCY
ncbi:MAG: hypothetical protein ACRCY4_04125 [Brevinema sp.]